MPFYRRQANGKVFLISTPSLAVFPSFEAALNAPFADSADAGDEVELPDYVLAHEPGGLHYYDVQGAEPQLVFSCDRFGRPQLEGVEQPPAGSAAVGGDAAGPSLA